jgi:hypothetical protein
MSFVRLASSRRVLLVVLSASSSLSLAAPAQTISVGKDMSIVFRGFISATAFAQDQNFQFGNGQNAEWPETPETTVDRWFGGADVRNTRLGLVFNGPRLGTDWRVNATFEMDFFGGNNGTGAFAGQQPVPRLRLAYAELTNGSTTIQVGQQWAPLWGNLPVSVTHLSFPLGWASGGLIGWRYPGIFVGQKLTGSDAPVNMDLQLAVMSGNWNGPESTTDFETAGNATWPQVELRYNVGGKIAEGMTWSGYVVGHLDEKDLSGAGESAPNDKLTGSAVEIGAKFQLGSVLVQGNAYSGHSIGQQFATINQFGKIQSDGGWVQVGWDFTPNWGIYGFWGTDNPKDSDALAAFGDAARLKNVMYAGMLRWKCGPFSAGVEYLHSRLTSGFDQVETTGQQLSLSALFNF